LYSCIATFYVHFDNVVFFASISRDCLGDIVESVGDLLDVVTRPRKKATATQPPHATPRQATRPREHGSRDGVGWGGGILLYASPTVAVVADEDSRLLQVSLRACGKGVALSSLRMYWYLMLTD